MWLRKKRFKKKLKSLIRFHSASKIDNFNRGGGTGEGREKKKKKNPKESTEQVKT